MVEHGYSKTLLARKCFGISRSIAKWVSNTISALSISCLCDLKCAFTNAFF